ncbi:hypothetical protein QY96_03237 [Bacillus thermotolerans]|nr:hypothetical protein QY96_03237 [Bacillus thermotolerans]
MVFRQPKKPIFLPRENDRLLSLKGGLRTGDDFLRSYV